MFVDSHLESTLYYTMSTVAQTLAGAIGLLGAIVLFTLLTTAGTLDAQTTTKDIGRAHV